MTRPSTVQDPSTSPAAEPAPAPAPGPEAGDERLTMLYDGACPLCKREVRMLRKMDRRGRLAFDDIAAADFDPGRYGVTREQADARIHARTPEGEMITGVEVFRRAYAAVGKGWLVGWTAWPVVRPMVDAAYRWFARNRHRLTGRSCPDGACAPRGA